jgi:hypothetical protein
MTPRGEAGWNRSVLPAHTAASQIGRPVSSVVKRISCTLREVRMAVSRRKKKAVVSPGRRSTTSGGVARASQRPCIQLAGKRKANELASSGDSSEQANRRPAPGVRSAPLPTIASVTGEEPAVGNREHGPPEGGVTYADVLAGPVSPFQPSESLKLTAMGSDPFETAVS